MNYNPETLLKMQQDSFKATNTMAAKVFESFQKLAELNAQMTRQSLTQVAERNMALLSAKDPQAAADALKAFANPTEGSVDFARNVYELLATTRAEFTAMTEKNFAEANQQMIEAIDALAKSAPAGSEKAIAFMKQSVAATTAAYEQFSKGAKQFNDAIETQFAAATKAKASKQG